jgi:hypothetical protein
MQYEPDFLTTDELLSYKEGTFYCDTESYPNYFLVAFQCYHTNKIAYFEAIGEETIPKEWLAWMLANFTMIGFNFKGYDLIMLSMALAGKTVRDIHNATVDLIAHGMKPRDLEKRYEFSIMFVNFVDVIEVCPLKGSQKLYAARLGCRHLQDLPYDPAQHLSREEIAVTRSYCFNDLDNLMLITKELEPFLELRATMSAEYGKDLRSLSDAQLAQEIINTRIAHVTGSRPKRPNFEDAVGTTFRYAPPAYVRFAADRLNAMLAEICAADIEIGSSGHVECPKAIDGRKVEIGGRIYSIGMGGLHSNEQRQALTNDSERILDRDVTGYYPNLILKNGFAPEHLGNAFLPALQSIVDDRYAAKKSGDKATADGLKIASNGTFGKTSDPYSTIYSPNMMVQTTLTGQLSLLMVIERLSMFGFQVSSANTDGIVTLCPHNRYEEFCEIFKQWEQITNLETEETEYKALYSRDVNNYIAFKMDGKHKAKGAYSEFGSALNSPLSKNPTCFVAIDAAVKRIASDVPVMDTIRACSDVKRFLTVRNVKGGAQKNGRYLGKVVRWYYAKGVQGVLSYCTNGNSVALTEGAKPLMTLPESFPADMDYERYATLATDILEDVGYQMRKGEQFGLTLTNE